MFDVILVLLIMISFVLMVVGLIKPGLVIRWGTKRTRPRALLTYGGLFVALFIILGFSASNDIEPKTKVATAKVEEAAKPTVGQKVEASESKEAKVNYDQAAAKNRINDWLWEHEFPNNPKLTLDASKVDGGIYEIDGVKYHMFTLGGLKRAVTILVDPTTGDLMFHDIGLKPQPLDKWYMGYITASKGNYLQAIDENFAWVEKPSTLDGAVTGIVKNTSNKKFKNVYIQFNCYDDNGNKIGTLDQQISNLNPGETWKFAILFYVPNMATYDFASIDGFTW